MFVSGVHTREYTLHTLFCIMSETELQGISLLPTDLWPFILPAVLPGRRLSALPPMKGYEGAYKDVQTALG